MSERDRARLLKLLALAERGVGGERVNAQAALDEALKAHGLTMAALFDEELALEWFGFKGPFERRLLAQVLSTVLGRKAKLMKLRDASKLGAEMTHEQCVEVEVLWTAHRRQLKKELEAMLEAYVCRQNLFPADVDDGEERPPLTAEDVARIEKVRALGRGIDRVAVRKQIGGAA